METVLWNEINEVPGFRGRQVVQRPSMRPSSHMWLGSNRYAGGLQALAGCSYPRHLIFAETIFHDTLF
jgi:hypothetical protein